MTFDENTEVTDMSEVIDYDAKRQAQVEAIGDSIRELQYLLAPQYEAQAERCKRLYFAEQKRLSEPKPTGGLDVIMSEGRKEVSDISKEIADGHALINPLITGIELLQKALALL